MVSVFKSGSSSQGLSPGQGHCVVFLGQTLYFLPTQMYKWVLATYNAGGNSLIQGGRGGGIEIFLVASCYRNQDKLQPVGALV